MSYIDIINPPWQMVAGTGVSPGFLFSASGTINSGAFLSTGTTSTNLTGQPIFGSNKLIRMRVSVSENVSTKTVIQISVRTGVNTKSDITGAAITLEAGEYTKAIDLDIELPNNCELCCYVKQGSCKNPVVALFLIQY